jgi:hygromycin-B 4-O-kinase
VLPRLLQVLDAMRAIDLSETTGFGLWGADGRGRYSSWREALLDIAVDRPANRTYGWRRQLAAWPTAEEAFAIGFAQLERSLEVCPNERHLVHSDLLNFNLLVDHDRVTGAIDWGSALYGDFVWDIAWLTFWQPWYPAWRDVDIARFAREHYSAIGLDVPDFEARLRCYELAIGLDGMAYQAFTRRWRDLDDTARRVVALAQSQR